MHIRKDPSAYALSLCDPGLPPRVRDMAPSAKALSIKK